MKIGNIEVNSDLKTILDKFIREVHSSGLNYFSKNPRDSGDYIMVQCPYHKFGQERHPSAQFRKSDGLFYCHGCKESHQLPTVISYCLNKNGYTWLRDNFQTDNIEERNVNFNLPTKQLPKKQSYINKDVLKQYRFTHTYMFERKLNLDIIRKFDIGYDKNFILKTEVDGTIQTREIGECITFPIKDENGNILFIARRAINQKFFHYPENVDKPLYGYYEILRERRHGKEINEVYIVESMLDALYIWTLGKYAIALNGTGSSKQYELLKKSDFRLFILGTDNDFAGKKSREKLKANITNKLIKEIDYKSYGSCKDINDMTPDQFLNANII